MFDDINEVKELALANNEKASVSEVNEPSLNDSTLLSLPTKVLAMRELAELRLNTIYQLLLLNEYKWSNNSICYDLYYSIEQRYVKFAEKQQAIIKREGYAS